MRASKARLLYLPLKLFVFASLLFVAAPALTQTPESRLIYAHSPRMEKLIQDSDDPDDQATKFSGKSLPPASEYYSKAGWTSSTRHDSAYIRLPNGAEYILAVFTVDNSKQADIIPFVSRLIAEEFSRTQPAADLILINGRLWTGLKSQPWAEALASRGERIIAVARTATSESSSIRGPESLIFKESSRNPVLSTITLTSSLAVSICSQSNCETQGRPKSLRGG
jgi:hypothetical protein